MAVKTVIDKDRATQLSQMDYTPHPLSDTIDSIDPNARIDFGILNSTIETDQVGTCSHFEACHTSPSTGNLLKGSGNKMMVKLGP